MKSMLSTLARVAIVAAVSSFGSTAIASSFTAGNIVVLRVGDGSAAPGATLAAPVFLDEYTSAGTLVQSIPVPTTTSAPNFRLTLHGLETAVGALNRSTDGRYLTFAGYDAPVGTANLTTTVASTNPRVIARVDSTGAIDTQTTVTDGFARVASVITDDGSRFWSTGNNAAAPNIGGLRYSASLGASTSTLVVAAPNNLLVSGIYAGQLLTSASFGSPNFLHQIATVGTGLPTTTGQSATRLPGTDSTTGTHASRAYFYSSPTQFFLVDTGTTANGGGLQKWDFNGTSWIKAGSPYPIASPTTANGLGGLTGTVNGLNITLFATTVDTAGNSLVKYTSTDGGASFSSSVIATSPTGSFATLFRGVAMAPSQEVNVKVNGTTVFTGGTFNFGSFNQAVGAQTKTVTVENTGAAALTIGASGVTITTNPPFSTSGAPAASTVIAAGATATFDIAYDMNQPAATYNSVLTINSDDSDEAAYVINLSGTTTVVPEADLTNGVTPVASGGSATFPAVNVGATAPSVTLTLTNSGSAALSIASAVASTGFTVTEGLPASLNPGASDTVTVTLDSTAAAGTQTGTLTITSNDADEGTYVVNLSATVNAVPEADLSQGVTPVASGGTVTFAAVSQFAPAPSVVLTLTNNGSATLNTSALTPPAGFTVTEGLSSTIAAGASDTFTVELSSTATAGTTTGALTFASDDADEPLYTVNLSATVNVSDVQDWMALDN